MKKIKLFIAFTFLFFFSTLNVNAANEINQIDVNLTLDENGNAHVVEKWDIKTEDGTEIYKSLGDIGKMEVSNFNVVDDDNQTYTSLETWDISETFENKKYKNGINNNSGILELCWGISEYGNKVYTISYDLSNFVFQTNDSQIIYYNVFGDTGIKPKDFYFTMNYKTPFESTLDVWGYGYKGYAYVEDGLVKMTSENGISKTEYAVLLVKFPVDYFKSELISYTEYSNFEAVKTKADEGSYEQDYDNESFFSFGEIFVYIFIIFTTISIFASKKGKYTFKHESKKGKLKKNEVRPFRDIPKNIDIYKGNFICEAYNLKNKKENNIIGTIILKWLFENKITITKEKKNSIINLTEVEEFENEVEKDLYEILKNASNDNKLKPNDLKKYSKKHYKDVIVVFDDIFDLGVKKYLKENQVERKGKNRFYLKDTLKEDALKISGLKKFLIEFSRIKEKRPIEVMLWKDYLMFAQLFGMADEVAKQFKNLYPEILEEYNKTNIDIVDIMILNNMSNSMVANAYSAKSAAESAARSYSSGGGGFSVGGGGGGSFGGGGGGGFR